MPKNVIITEGKPTWSDLLLTNYPWYIDSRQSAIDEGSIDPLTGNPQFKLNVNFEDRTRTTKAKDYYVMAEDINAIQDAVIGIQRTLGLVPYGNEYDVAARLNEIERFVVMAKSKLDGHMDLDSRYMWGGSWPTDSNNNKAANISIKTHRHTGTFDNAQKINLSSEVTDKLSKLNIQLTSKDINMLTANDIYTTAAMTETISQSLDKKYDKTGGTISGNVFVQGNFRCLTMAEIDCKDTAKVVGTDRQDYKAYSGYSRYASAATASGKLVETIVPLRYGKYVAGIRMKTGSQTSASPVIEVVISDQNNIVATRDTLAPNTFKTNDYETFYIEFEHANRSGSVTKADAKIVINFFNGITSIDLDSIIIQPVTTAVYDDDSFLI